jgi:hypothetical protein
MIGRMSNRVARFVDRVQSENPKLVKQIQRLDAEVHGTLDELLARFDRGGKGALDDAESSLAARVVALLHRPSAPGLDRLLTVLDYLDVNRNRVLEHEELALAVEILELFCKADSVNATLSVKELDMLHAVLQHFDSAGRGVLDLDARSRLRDELWDPDAFLESQKKTNARLRGLLT